MMVRPVGSPIGRLTLPGGGGGGGGESTGAIRITTLSVGCAGMIAGRGATVSGPRLGRALRLCAGDVLRPL
jgi:hypothetical protein